MITIDARWINTSGIGTYLKNIIPGIISALPEYSFTLLGDISELKKIKGINGSRINYIQSNSPMYSIREQIDYLLVIPKNTKLFLSPHYNIPVFYSGPMLVIVYDVCHFALPGLVQGFHKKAYLNFMFKILKKKASKILTISEFSKREIIKYTGINSNIIEAIHLGVDTNFFKLTNYIPVTEKPYILSVGNIKPHKNLISLIKAFILVLDYIPHNLVLVGKKEGFITADNDVIDSIERYSERIHFTGYVSDSHLKSYYSNADIFIFPSLYEGFGFPPLESMALGCPVLASNSSSIPEICNDAAIYFNPQNINEIADKILLLIKDQKLKNKLIKLGIINVKKYSWNECSNRTVNVIKELM